jgi:hypothetical protein
MASETHTDVSGKAIVTKGNHTLWNYSSPYAFVYLMTFGYVTLFSEHLASALGLFLMDSTASATVLARDQKLIQQRTTCGHERLSHSASDNRNALISQGDAHMFLQFGAFDYLILFSEHLCDLRYFSRRTLRE